MKTLTESMKDVRPMFTHQGKRLNLGRSFFGQEK